MTQFQIEERVFDRSLDEWIAQRRAGSYAVIAGERLIGVRRTFDAAMRLGVREMGLGLFMVKQIWPRGTVEWSTHLEVPPARVTKRAG